MSFEKPLWSHCSKARRALLSGSESHWAPLAQGTWPTSMGEPSCCAAGASPALPRGVAGFWQTSLTQVQERALPRNHRSASGFQVSPTSPFWVTDECDAGICLWVEWSQDGWDPCLLEGALGQVGTGGPPGGRQQGSSAGAPRPAGPQGQLCAGPVASSAGACLPCPTGTALLQPLVLRPHSGEDQ